MTDHQAKLRGLYRAYLLSREPMPYELVQALTPATRVELVPLNEKGFKHTEWAERLFGPLPPVPVLFTTFSITGSGGSGGYRPV